MAAPATTARQTPNGTMMRNGHPTKVACALDPDICFWEKGGQPPSLDAGDAIDTTTAFNTSVRTKAPRALVDLGDCVLSNVGYDPDAYNQIMAVIGVETSWTVTFSDGSTLDFFGFLRLFEPADSTEGDHPQANVTITPTNWDPVNNEEAMPVLTSVAGT